MGSPQLTVRNAASYLSHFIQTFANFRQNFCLDTKVTIKTFLFVNIWCNCNWKKMLSVKCDMKNSIIEIKKNIYTYFYYFKWLVRRCNINCNTIYFHCKYWLQCDIMESMVFHINKQFIFEILRLVFQRNIQINSLIW